MIRDWISNFSKSVNKHTVARRREMSVPIKITFDVDRNMGNLQPFNNLFIMGKTTDISSSGIGFIVSSIRLKEFYLVGEDRVLNAELNLPNGKIAMQMQGKRYEQIGNKHLSISEYIIGAKIVRISDDDLLVYDECLKGKRHKTISLNLKTDKSKA